MFCGIAMRFGLKRFLQENAISHLFYSYLSHFHSFKSVVRSHTDAKCHVSIGLMFLYSFLEKKLSQVVKRNRRFCREIHLMNFVDLKMIAFFILKS